jgi:3-hydroxyisobutyrate dehydrogenase-like beta-hydroxyacid dehydrogenase
MRIAVIGAGNVGGALAAAATAAGHQVTLAATHPEHAEKVAEQTNATAARTPAEAARDADVVVLAVPGGAAVDAVRELLTDVVYDALTELARTDLDEEDEQDAAAGAHA